MLVNGPVETRTRQTIQAELQGNDDMAIKVIAFTWVDLQEVTLNAQQATALYEGLIAAGAKPADNLATLSFPGSFAAPLDAQSGKPITSATKTDGESESITTVGDLADAGECTVRLGGAWLLASDATVWRHVSSIKTACLKISRSLA